MQIPPTIAPDTETSAPVKRPYEELSPLNRGDRNLNPAGIGFLALLREDLRTFDNDPFDPGFPRHGGESGQGSVSDEFLADDELCVRGGGDLRQVSDAEHLVSPAE